MGKRPRTGVLLTIALGAVIGLIAFEASLGLALVNPRRTDWMMVAPGDFSTHFFGWHLFRTDTWRWPLGATGHFIYPLGTSVGLTDSIPLLAIPLKIFRSQLSESFQYLGFWLMCSFVLQGAIAALLMRTRTTDVALLVLGSALFVLAPPLLARHGHTALTAHWLILGCFWVYYSFEDPRHSRRAFSLLAALTVVAAAVHPYLSLMVMALSAAFFGRVVLLTPQRWLGGAVIPLAMLGALTGLVFWQSGYFVVGSDALQAEGLTHYSMNVLAPVMPMGTSWLVPDFVRPATSGQYEGFAYFGAGLLALSLVVVVKVLLDRHRLGSNALSHVPLIVVCTFLAIAALSPQVTLGETTLFHYSDVIWGPLRQFRAPGRLFWPAFYALVFLVISLTTGLFSRRAAIVLLVFAVALQSVDGARGFGYARGLRELSWRSPLRTADFWTGALPHYRHISLYPTNVCVPLGVALDYPAFAMLAGRFGNTLNAGQATRLDPARVAEYCRFQTLEQDAGIVDDSTLYVMSIRVALGFSRRATAPVSCVDVDEFGVCFARDTYRQWQDAFDVNLAMVPPLQELVRFRGALDAEYRDGLKRSAQGVQGSSEERVLAIARFVTYRLTGCDREEAIGKVVRELSGERELRLCANHRARRLSALENPAAADTLPTRDETVQLLHIVNGLYMKDTTRKAGTSHIDTEGEAVWIQEYLGHRLAGRSAADSHDLVLREIRSATP